MAGDDVEEARAYARAASPFERAALLREVEALVRDPVAQRAFIARSSAPWTTSRLVRASVTALAALRAESG